jgi:tRNA nucleotidyltransferase (CCA-adding enzyme)
VGTKYETPQRTTLVRGTPLSNANNLSVFVIYPEKNQIEYLGQNTLR